MKILSQEGANEGDSNFYKYCVIRSPYSRISWLRTWSQLLMA